jgi:phage N-6-adenine-methyltransferase
VKIAGSFGRTKGGHIEYLIRGRRGRPDLILASYDLRRLEERDRAPGAGRKHSIVRNTAPTRLHSKPLMGMMGKNCHGRTGQNKVVKVVPLSIGTGTMDANSPLFLSGGRDDWETPDELMAVLRQEFAFFNLDPAATAANSKGLIHYGPDRPPPNEDGLSRPWFGKVFLNPPFGLHGKDLPRWVMKAASEVAAGRVKLVVALLPARTDTAWWSVLVAGVATEVRFLQRRLRFKGGKRSATFPSALVIYREGQLGWGHVVLSWDWRPLDKGGTA